MGEWDTEEVRRLFTSLEFRTLLDRLRGRRRTARSPRSRWPSSTCARSRADELAGARGRRQPRWACASTSTRGRPRGGGVGRRRAGGVRGRRRRWRRSPRWLADPTAPEVGPRREGVRARRRDRRRRAWRGVAFDTMLAGYLLDPGRRRLPARRAVRALPRRRRARRGGASEDETGSCSPTAVAARPRAEAAAVALLAPVMEERIDKQGLRELLRRRRAAAGVGAGAHGGARRRARRRLPSEMGEARARPDGHARGRDLRAGRRGVQPQLAAAAARDPVREARAPARQEDAEGRSSRPTPSVLEKLRDQHPIVDALLAVARARQAELHLPRGAAARWSIRATAASTPRSTRPWRPPGGFSSSNPNLQNIPVRTELGPRRSAGRSCPASRARCCWCADYSQIELRILAHLSGDEGLREAFATGARHPHGDRRAACSDCREDTGRPGAAQPREDGQLRPRLRHERLGARARLDIAPDEAQEIMDAYFARVPDDPRVPRPAGAPAAVVDGYTETHARPPPVHPRAPGREPPGARPRAADGAERPDPGQREPTSSSSR